MVLLKFCQNYRGPGYGFSDAKGQSSAGNGGDNSKRVFGT